MIRATVIADSIYDGGPRLTTMELRYPRFIHAEFMTHRVFSRNASSSRAVPVEKMIQQVMDDPAMPIHWGRNQAGMQAREELDTLYLEAARRVWRAACRDAVSSARSMAAMGAHKQIVNRILEPFSHISVICSATEWDNFFELRCHPDAQPEMQALACAMRDARDASTPAAVGWSGWHLPYIRDEDRAEVRDSGFGMQWWALARISAARCARVSYLTHDGRVPSIAEDLALFERLAGSRPIHASPLEHQATPARNRGLCGNFRGWAQHRKFVETEC